MRGIINKKGYQEEVKGAYSSDNILPLCLRGEGGIRIKTILILKLESIKSFLTNLYIIDLNYKTTVQSIKDFQTIKIRIKRTLK